MTVTIFAAVGFVFAVNNKNGKVMQLTAVEAIVLASYFTSLAAEAMIDLVLSMNEEFLHEANGLKELADSLELAALESTLG